MESLPEFSHFFENRDPNELLLIFGLFFALLALITLIYWIFFLGGDSRDRGGVSSDIDSRNTRRNDGANAMHLDHQQQRATVTNHDHRGRDLDRQNQQGGVIRTEATSSLSSSQYVLERESRRELSRTEIEHYFSRDISNSYARWDDEYGIIYIVPPMPNHTDDLKLISGIDVAYERELHRIGIFMFKQMANWTDHNCHHISEELRSGELLYRENWPARSAALHEQKYGEKL